MSSRYALAAVVALCLTACGDSSTSPDNGTPGTPNTPITPPSSAALRGRAAFVANCASCHNSADGVDLAFFNFADSTITRRALKHVDQATTNDILAHLATLRSNPHPRDERLFQPGGVVLANDAAFGQALFPGDVFPTDMTTARMRALNRTTVSVAIPFPRWSVENSNLDWLPDVPPSSAVMGDQNGLPQRALDAYRANPTQSNLLTVMVALFSALERDDSPGPCHFESRGRVDANECFQATRWASILVAQHMMRNNLTAPLPDTSFHNLWWEVGESVRRAGMAGTNPANALQNRNAWMYLGWMFGADARPSLYILPTLEGGGYPRHATWVIVRGMVDRPVNSPLPYDDVMNLPRYGADPWLYGALRFSYRHLLERINAGDLPPSARRAEARNKVSTSFNEASPRLTTAQRDDLRILSQAVLNVLPAN